MKSITKKVGVLLKLGIVLAVVILIYYLGYSRGLLQTAMNKEPLKTVAASPTPNPNKPAEVDQYYLSVNKNLAIDPKVIDSLLFYKKGILQKSIITNTHRGRVALISRDGARAYYDYYSYKLKLILLDPENAKVAHGFYFSENDLKNAVVQEYKNGQYTPITIYDLKNGDDLEIDHEIDALTSIPYPVFPGKSYTYKTKSMGFNTIALKIIRFAP